MPRSSWVGATDSRIGTAGNGIYNVAIPIDLGIDGSTPNDAAPDADTGGNNLQNFPALTLRRR